MKLKVDSLVGLPTRGKKDRDSGMVKIIGVYPDGTKRVHMLYFDDYEKAVKVVSGDIIDVEFQEFAFAR